jgi:hypothetical protein
MSNARSHFATRKWWLAAETQRSPGRCLPGHRLGSASATAVVLGLLIAGALATPLHAQAQQRIGAALAPSPKELVEAQIKTYVEPLRQRLPLEIQFLDEVCGLSDEQLTTIEKAGRAAVDLVAQEMTAALERNRHANGSRMVVTINGRAVAVPAGLDRDVLTAPDQAVRRKLARVLQADWPEIWAVFDAESRRLDGLRKEAGILAQVAVLDECLLLSNDQRKSFCDFLALPASDDWWNPAVSSHPMLNPVVERLQISLAGGTLGHSFFPEAAVAKLLQPPQLAAFKELQRPRREEVVLVRQAVVVKQAGAAPLQVHRILRQGPRTEDQQRQLISYLERAVGDLDASCGLSAAQKQKLLLAGKLDVQAWREQVPSPPDKLPPGQEMVIQMRQVVGSDARLPSSIFSEAASCYQKALHNRLLDEQKQKLAAAGRERRAFQREALVALVVLGFERCAALTAAQCEALTTMLDEAAPFDEESPNDWRVDFLQRIAQLPEQKLRPIFFDFQWPAASQQLAKLAGEARHFQSQISGNVALGAPAAVGAGMF